MITLTAKVFESDAAWIGHNIAPVDQEEFLRLAVARAIEQERARRMDIRLTVQSGVEFHDTPTDSVQLEMKL